ncbi:hypothetical protein SDC9_87892 [bioreactor metagenome]|uniref:Uncharacterized protein n=1 Tax=bioreactor metagenome TaxID=1076179 RepID=A0A644ZK41_9ZZZZ
MNRDSRVEHGKVELGGILAKVEAVNDVDVSQQAVGSVASCRRVADVRPVLGFRSDSPLGAFLGCIIAENRRSRKGIRLAD